VTALRLGEVAAQLEAERFVGREALLALADAATEGSSPQRILLVHGPGGVGKSALLRAIERRAIAAGLPTLALDGRVVAPTPVGLDAALAPAADLEQVVVLIDEVDELAPLRLELRRAVLDALPASATVVIAGRRPPARTWFEGVLASIVASIAVRPLSNEESADLLSRYDIRDPAVVDHLVAWGQGYPLALTVAASLPAPGTGGRVPDANRHGPEATLDDVLLERLGADELAGVDPDVLDVACIAPAVDARLLAAVLPGRATRDGLAQLRALSIAEAVGSRTTLHRLARTALRARLRTTDPDRHRALVLKVAAHLRERGLAERPIVGLELADLVESPDLRVGFDASTTHYADLARPDDVEIVAAATGAGDTAWFARFRRWCDEPRKAFAVRRADGSLSALSIVSMASDVPPWAWDDLEAGPVLRHAEAAGTLEQAALMHDAIFLETDPAALAEAVRVGNAGTIALGAIGNPRYVYVTATHRLDDGTEPLGYRDVPELRRADDERELGTMMTDFGPDGFVGQVYAIVLAEQQGEAPAAAGGSAIATVEALRSFHDDAALAASPLAAGNGAEHARDALRTAIDGAFSTSEADQLLRRALERTYLDPDGGHGRAQRELHMSRSSFYRHLQRARQQLASHVSDASDPS
jgi:SpoVK/Ycf46/Vps4 family AAA+-type ATPase